MTLKRIICGIDRKDIDEMYQDYKFLKGKIDCWQEQGLVSKAEARKGLYIWDNTFKVYNFAGHEFDECFRHANVSYYVFAKEYEKFV